MPNKMLKEMRNPRPSLEKKNQMLEKVNWWIKMSPTRAGYSVIIRNVFLNKIYWVSGSLEHFKRQILKIGAHDIPHSHTRNLNLTDER